LWQRAQCRSGGGVRAEKKEVRRVRVSGERWVVVVVVWDGEMDGEGWCRLGWEGLRRSRTYSCKILGGMLDSRLYKSVGSAVGGGEGVIGGFSSPSTLSRAEVARTRAVVENVGELFGLPIEATDGEGVRSCWIRW